MSLDYLLTLDAEHLLGAIGKAAFENQEQTRDELPPEVLYQISPEYDPVELGRRILHRIERQLHELICSDAPNDSAERDSIRSTIGLGDITLAVVLVSTLTSQFGVDHKLAIPISAFIVKYIFNPAGNELCDFWAERVFRFK